MTSINNYSSNSFINIFNDTKILLDQLTLNLTTLKSYQQKRIIVKFDEDENDEIDKQIKDLAHSMTNKVKNVEENIKKLNSYPKENLSENEMKLNINMKLTLAQRLKEFTQEFRLNENNYLNSYKEFGGEKKKDEEILDEDDSNNNFFQINEGNEILKKRDEEINVLLESIVDLSSLFKDMQNLVQEQGTILDRIDYNIDEAFDNTKKAHRHLEKANEHMKNNCFFKSIIMLMLIIFIEAVLIMFKYL
jgi:syntaxin 16